MNRLNYLSQLVAFAFRRNPFLYFSLVLSLLSVVIELAAMSILFPLSELVFGRQLAPGVSLVGGGWVVPLLKGLGISPGLKAVGILFLAVLILRVVTLLGSQGLTIFLGKRLHAQLSSMAFANIVQGVPIKLIEAKNIGHFVSLAGDESFRASNLVIAISQFTGVAALGILYFAAIAYFSVTAAVAVVFFLVVSFVALFTSFRKSHRLGAAQLEQSQLASSIFLDALNGLRAVRAMTAENYVVNRYRTEIFKYSAILFKTEFIGTLARLAPMVVLLSLGILLLGAWNPDGSALDAAFLFALLMYLMRFFPVVGQGLNLFLRVLTDAKAGRNVLEATKPTDVAALIQEQSIGKVESITIRNLNFEYVPDKAVLQNLDLEFVAGRSYAIMGSSGSGKSTLLDLLLGFRDPDSGEILINGIDVGRINPALKRQKILLLGQQTTIFNDTIFNNIAFGKDMTPAEVERAGRLANIEEMVSGLPEKYQTKLSYQGSNLSGGQRQRVGIARALARVPDVLMLDESTSALDRETLLAIADTILQEYREKIVIFVTHDHELAEKTDHVYRLSVVGQIDQDATQSQAGAPPLHAVADHPAPLTTRPEPANDIGKTIGSIGTGSA